MALEIRMKSRVIKLIGTTAGALIGGQVFAQTCDPQLNQIIQGSDGEALGSSISIMDNRAVIGAYAGVANGVDSGVAYTYAFDGEQWIQTGRLVPPDGASGDWFGLYTAMDHHRILIGSVRHDEGGTNVGAAYAYELIDNQWVFEQKLSPMNAVEDGGFGSVEVQGSRAAIGASGSPNGAPVGSVTVFEHDGERWNTIEEIIPVDAEPHDQFGRAIFLDGDQLIIGSPTHFDENQWSYAGAAYIFDFDGEHWVEQAKLVPSDLFGRVFFGRTVWVQGDRAVVGVHGAINQSGRIYCYGFENGQWVEQQIIEPEIIKTKGYFGVSISIDDDLMLVGSGGLGENQAH